MSLIIRCNNHYSDEILLFQMGACVSSHVIKIMRGMSCIVVLAVEEVRAVRLCVEPVDCPECQLFHSKT